jgi:hypothetical protein
VRSMEIGGLQMQGFESCASLLAGGLMSVSREPGIYAVTWDAVEEPRFLDASRGGHFKGVDPTVAVEVLRSAWIDDEAVLYIGKANVLQRRIRELCAYAAGRPVGHRAGRYLWQVDQSDEFLVSWCATPDQNARDIEIELLRDFAANHGGRLPYANIAG